MSRSAHDRVFRRVQVRGTSGPVEYSSGEAEIDE